MGYEEGPVYKDLRPPMDLWTPIKMNKTQIKDSSEYLTKNWSVIYWSDKIQDPNNLIKFGILFLINHIKKQVHIRINLTFLEYITYGLVT